MMMRIWAVGAVVCSLVQSGPLAAQATPAGSGAEQHWTPDSTVQRRAALTPPTAAPRTVDLPARGAEMPMYLVSDHPQIDVMINGHGPYRFIVETGASFSAITPEVAAALGLRASDAANPSVLVDSLSIGDARLRLLRVAIFPIGVPGVDGVLGLNAYRDVLLTLDYPRARLRLERGALPPANGRDRVALTRVADLFGIPIEVDGRGAVAVLDTQGGGVFDVTPAVAADVAFVAAPVVMGTAQGPGIGVQQQQSARMRGDVRVGDVRFQRPIVGIVPMPPDYPQIWNMGAGALREFTVTLDERHGVVRLARMGRMPVPAPPPVRTAGVRSQLRDGRRVVLDVRAGSEAERLGLRPGDELLLVNGRPAKDVTSAAWNALVQRDQPIQIVFEHDDTAREITLTPYVLVQ